MPSRYFVIIDGHALIYRAYHAFPSLTTSAGTQVNAVYGFTRILLTVIRNFEPEYLAVTFDHPKPTKRHEAFADYKAHREKMPDDMIPQIQIIKDVVKAMNVPTFELEGYEADDLIGTISCQLAKRNERSDEDERLIGLIVTGDKDLLQLVNESIHVFMPKRGKFGEDIEYTSVKFEEKFGLKPKQIIELKALMGDSSDNIPGVKGVGQKTATKLIQTFGSIDRLYEAIEDPDSVPDDQELPRGSALAKLVEGKASALMSRELVTINCEAPVELKLEECTLAGYDKEKVVEVLRELEFESLVPLLPMDQFESGVQNALF